MLECRVTAFTRFREHLPDQVRLAGTSKTMAFRGHEPRVELEAVHPLGTSNRYASWATRNAYLFVAALVYVNLQRYGEFFHRVLDRFNGWAFRVESALACGALALPVVARVRRYGECAR